MVRNIAIVVMTLVLIAAIPVSAAEKGQPRLVRIGDAVPGTLTGQLIGRPSLATADTCIVRHDAGIYYRIDGWVYGNELYKGFCDPGASCDGPYPFQVTAINMPMSFGGTPTISVSVDIELVDWSVPGCPTPDTITLAISSIHQFEIPEPGSYDIWIPLDTPITVTEPFFAGFFLGNEFTVEDAPGVFTDTIPALCTSYNVWDEAIGFVDLCSTDYWDGEWSFPGRLVLYAAGIPGGSGGPQPEPVMSFVFPVDSDTLYASGPLFVWEEAGSEIIDYVLFEYNAGGGYVEIGRDYFGDSPLRNGVDSADSGDGFSYQWDFSSLPEGMIQIRATAVDTLGRSSSDSIDVYIEPTPPIPVITSPDNGADFCGDVSIIMYSPDEDLSHVSVYRKAADYNFSAGLNSYLQTAYGDVDNHPTDGNPIADGEYGEYYSGPVAAAIAIEKWTDRGYPALMQENIINISVHTLIERLAQAFGTRMLNGTTDESMLAGLQYFSQTHGNLLDFDMMRSPDYFNLRYWVEDEERTVIMGIGGDAASFVAVDGFRSWSNSDVHIVRVSNPVSGLIEEWMFRNSSSPAEVQISGAWHTVDVMISLSIPDWQVARTLVGVDFNGADGWSTQWTPSGMSDGDLMFLHAVGTDGSALVGADVIMMRYDCGASFTVGDYNGDAEISILDVQYLIEFLALGGPPPVGGVFRADANCDRVVNITDVVYYMNYLFGYVASPCY